MPKKIQKKTSSQRKRIEKKEKLPKQPAPIEIPTPVVEKKTAHAKTGEFIYGIGKRKTSRARVRFYEEGKGEIIVNEKDYRQYFPQEEFQTIVRSPLEVTNLAGTGRFTIRVEGGGVRGQAESTRHGIARALITINPALRPILRQSGYLTRDARMKERKKYGLKGARRAPQWQKR